jgi:peptidoglycan/xylan/chitin deacetylase (PgdA/CDA1 family)
MYFIKAAFWLRLLYRPLLWRVPEKEPVLYLTFDDGPHALATPFVLDQLKKYNAKASFFCIGKNVDAERTIFERILSEGHKVGNHTQNHVNGWKVSTHEYLANIDEATNSIHSSLFRPPYGRIRFNAIAKVKSLMTLRAREKGLHTEAKIVMWDVLSGDFDERLSPEKCLQNVLKHTEKGSIIVFHDSAKAWERMEYALPKMLEFYTDLGFRFKVIPD